MNCNRDRGFSLVELCVVIMIAFTLMGIGVIGAMAILPGMHANKSMYLVISQLRTGREQAMSQRRRIEVIFQNGNQIQLVRQNVPASLGTTVLGTSTFENNCQFRKFAGVPDTPDAFGNATPVDFGSATRQFFLPDGTLVDQNGNPISGSVFFGIADQEKTARAVTVLGATGRIRGYRWNGDSWIQ